MVINANLTAYFIYPGTINYQRLAGCSVVRLWSDHSTGWVMIAAKLLDHGVGVANRPGSCIGVRVAVGKGLGVG